MKLLQNGGEAQPYKNSCRLFDPNRPWRKPDLKREKFLSPLYSACFQDLQPIVSALLEAGVDPDDENHGYGSCLRVAASKGHLGTVKALLKAGANVKDGVDTYVEWLCRNYIIAASAAGHADVVALLLEHGADPNSFY
ncbi:ankyrin repeat-containing domain protein [Hypoxylon fragiforme]|uniref:ankyrin repeat-containing domain protein n=1 Tax=Hypoxylon fragiforme TaxID=63214 RepID=UPI0020C7127B|nr:ankyrin repeat-containing domain protein [Hypoxylon fragiforme]KAI2606802.1 ankyrin repeat-containing domain protein [Hypoxylon fragiforme]